MSRLRLPVLVRQHLESAPPGALVCEPELAPSDRTLERERWAAARELTARWR